MLVIKQIKLICTICNMLYSRDVAFVSFLQLRLNVLCSETDLIQIISDSPESREKTPYLFVECASWCLIHEPMHSRLSNQKHRNFYNLTLVNSPSPPLTATAGSAQLPGAGDPVPRAVPRAVPAFLWILQQELLAMEHSHPGTLVSQFGASTDTFYEGMVS